MLPNFFSDFFDTNQKLDNIKFEYVDNGAYEDYHHPDSTLACHLKREGIKMHINYIGVSFMACVLCSEFLDTLNVDYRGRSGKLFSEWEVPVIENEANVQLLKDHLINIISNASKNAERPIDPCTQKLKLYSDDICKLLGYFGKNRPNRFINTNTSLHFLEENLQTVFDNLQILRIQLVEKPCGINCN